jgi:hypothetical protein
VVREHDVVPAPRPPPLELRGEELEDPPLQCTVLAAPRGRDHLEWRLKLREASAQGVGTPCSEASRSSTSHYSPTTAQANLLEFHENFVANASCK